MLVHNVRDGRAGSVVGSWEVEPLVYDALGPKHVGRTVIYLSYGGHAEAGTITSWHDGVVFARYSKGDTAAGVKPEDLVLAVEKKYPNGAPMFAPDGTMLDDKGNRSIFDDVDE